MSRIVAIAALLAWSTLVGCAGSSARPVDRDEWEARSQRLLQPLMNESMVGCAELLIEISPNYFANVAVPALDPKMQTMKKTSADGVDEYVWTNLVGGLQGAISLTVGQTDQLTDKGAVRGKGTTFQALRQVTLRVHTKGVMEARLDVIASGKPLVMSMGGKVRDLESYEVRNGALFAP